MTNEEIIEVLHELDGTIYETQQVALDLAIKALEQQPSDDCVSRQAVIDNIDSISNHHGGISDIRLVVTQLPPVTPTFPKDATNGDVIKAMFPKAWGSNYIDISNKFTLYMDNDHELEVDIDWWNAPYKRGSEDG